MLASIREDGKDRSEVHFMDQTVYSRRRLEGVLGVTFITAL